MKKLLLLLALATSFSAQAQKFELGVNGGVNMYAGFKSNDFYLNNDIASADIYPTANISASYRYKDWKGGIVADFCQMGLFASAVDEFSGNAPGGLRFCIPARFVASRILSNKKVESYAGLSAGAIINPLRQTNVFYPDRLIRHGHILTGFCGGAQVGYTAWFSKHFGINQELSINYLNVSAPNSSAVQLCSFALTMGLRYRI